MVGLYDLVQSDLAQLKLKPFSDRLRSGSHFLRTGGCTASSVGLLAVFGGSLVLLYGSVVQPYSSFYGLIVNVMVMTQPYSPDICNAGRVVWRSYFLSAVSSGVSSDDGVTYCFPR